MGTVIETDRLVLRQMAWDDLDALAELYADPEVMRYIGSGQPRTREQSQKSLELFMTDNAHAWSPETLARLPQLRQVIERGGPFGLWATVLKAEGRMIGRCGLIPWNLDGRHEVEVGYMLAKPYWGRGLATEAAVAIREHGHHRLGFRRLVSLIQPGNVASRRVAEKVGMRYEGDILIHETPACVYASVLTDGGVSPTN
jgi:ribosomal-protein-alanine N-acetyltransferase